VIFGGVLVPLFELLSVAHFFAFSSIHSFSNLSLVLELTKFLQLHELDGPTP